MNLNSGEMFTLSTLNTVSGGSLAVLLIVQLLKDVPCINAVPTKVLTIILSEILMILTTNPFPKNMGDWIVVILNGVLLASTSIGGWHLINSNQSNQSSYKI